MLSRYPMQAFRYILAVLIISSIFSTGAFAQGGKIAPAVLAAAQEQETVSVVIRLQDQPSRQIAQAVQAQFFPNIEATAREIRNRVRPFRQQKQALPVDVQAEVRALNENLDSTTDQMRRDIYTQIWNRVSGGQQRVREALEKLGGTVQAQIAVTNAIGAEIPADVVNQIALLPEVRWIGKTSEPISLLDYSVPTIKASSFWDDGYTGGVHDVAIVDTGVDPDHPYLPTVANGRLIQNDPASLVEPSDPHGTQVAGVVASTLSNREGVAFGLDKLFDTRVGSWSVIYAGMEWAASHPEAADVLNHSQALIVGVDTVGVRYRMNNGEP